MTERDVPTTRTETRDSARRTASSTILAGIALVAGTAIILWYTPDSYAIYKGLHVLSIVVWVGGDVTLTTAGIVFERRSDGTTLAAIGKAGTWIGTRVYTPAAFAAFIFGALLIQKGHWGWHALWIQLALVGWAVATMIGIGFVGPELGRIDRAAQQYGPDSEEVGRRIHRLFAVFRFDTVLLVLIVLDMTVKPSF